jgi:hypothetical protein
MALVGEEENDKNKNETGILEPKEEYEKWVERQEEKRGQ